MITTAGRLFVEDALPEKYRGRAAMLDDKAVSALTTEMAKDLSPGEYTDAIQRLNNVGRTIVTNYGGPASLSLDDLIPTPDIQARHDALKAKVKVLQNSDDLSPEEKGKQIAALVDKETQGLDDALIESSLKQNNAFAHQFKGGIRGKKFQLRQMMLGNMLSVDSRGRTVPHPGLEGYGQGVSPMSYWASAHGSRKGYVDLQFATADAGYFGKQITNVAHRMVVTEPDCGARSVGIMTQGDDKDNVGSILAQDIGPFKKGTAITEDMLPAMADKEVMVRSPITCRAKEGLCAMCTGMREKGKLPDIGEHVGINAVRSFVEPLTQAQISAKHTAGEKASSLQRMSSFKQVNQFMQVPEEFVGGAVLSKKEGTVQGIEKAPQGGSNIVISGERHHVPEGYEIKVKNGDKLEAGDLLTDGMVNPEELVGYKGIGEGRKYFLDHLRKMLDEGGASTNRRNLEVLSKAFINKVRVTDPEGYNGHLPDDVVDYDSVASAWQPREGSGLKSLTSANKLYLEQPYMHYSIGTQVTPHIAENLRKHGVDQVMAHKDPPPFQPEVVRARDFSQYDKDWMVQMSGENLKKTLLKSTAAGASSERNSTSYYPKLVSIDKINL